jgi:hypothetical protein
MGWNYTTITFEIEFRDPRCRSLPPTLFLTPPTASLEGQPPNLFLPLIFVIVVKDSGDFFEREMSSCICWSHSSH